MTRIGIIGCGQWGPNHIRNFSNLAGSEVVLCADLSAKRLQAMREAFRWIRTTNNYKDILRDSTITAVVISTPTDTHFRIAKEALMARKDVLCEKPLCLKETEVRELIRLAGRKKRILMVGHVFLFNAGIQKLKEAIRDGECGRIYYMHSERTNLGPFRRDVNAVWDLAAHDISIFNYLLNSLPKEVAACGGRYLQQNLEDVAFISLVYPMDVLVNVHVSWLDPRKVRQITVVGDKRMMVWDDLDNVGPVRIYDKQVVPKYFYESFGEFHLLAKEGTITIPKVDLFEPLKAQAKHFIECVDNRKTPVSDAETGLEVVKVLTAVQKSLSKRGAPVPVR